MAELHDASDDEADKVVTALVLRTLFSGVDYGPWPEPLPATAQTALDWQSIGQNVNFFELHGFTLGLEEGRVAELVGRIAAAGEQLGLAWTCEQDMRRWLDPSAPRDRFSASSRALAEITGYYAMSAGHGLANVTLRTLLVHPEAAAVIDQTMDGKRAKGFAPFSDAPAAWISLNKRAALQLQAAGAIVGQHSVNCMTERVAALAQDPRWIALISRRNVDYHRWRPQSVAGGVPTSNPWERTGSGARMLAVGETSQYQPPDAEVVIQEAAAGLTALTEAMRDWLANWPGAIRDLGVPLLEEE